MAWINEFHYDNTGADAGEFIEIAGPPGTDLTGFTVVLYNGANGESYGTAAVFDGPGSVSTDPSGYVLAVSTIAGIQNGSADGLCLCSLVGPNGNPDSVVQFLSYEGTLMAMDGPCAGLTSTNIGVSESSSTAAGESLQLTGSGTEYGDYTWTGPSANTPGTINTGQTFAAGPMGPTGAPTNAPAAMVFIHEIQGTGDSSPLDGTVVTVEAVVVGDFQDGDDDTKRNLGGFYLQEEDADVDNDPLTSEGIFVFEKDAKVPLVDVRIGDLVQVTGMVDEFFGQTQIDTITSIAVISSSNTIPSATEIRLPTAATVVAGGDILPDLEAYEGMLVVFPQTLTINEMFNLDRFGEIKLVEGDRPFQFAQQNTPDAVGYQTSLEEIGARQITYEDGLMGQNNPIGDLDGFGPTYSTATDIRMGDTIDNLSGVLTYGSSQWRVQSTEDGENSFTKVNERPEPPEFGGLYSSPYKLASINVLNYFTTLDIDETSTTAIGMDPRGADNNDDFDGEFDRQSEKLVKAIVDMDADILGLVELENDFLPGSSGNALEYLVNAVNAELGTTVYEWVNPGQQFVDQSDAISNGFMYKKHTMSIRGGTHPAILRDEGLAPLGLNYDNLVFNGPSTNRAALAVDFQPRFGRCLMVSINHFKSKGSVNPAPGNADAGDGAGNNNAIRVQAAEAVTEWMDTNPTGRFCRFKALIGDLNSYSSEEPITLIESAGYTNVEEFYQGDDAYSFVFDGQIGTLDYIMVNERLLRRSSGAQVWHANADEPDANDYNTDFNRDPDIFDGSVPYRFSDHDPLIMGFWF